LSSQVTSVVSNSQISNYIQKKRRQNSIYIQSNPNLNQESRAKNNLKHTQIQSMGMINSQRNISRPKQTRSNRQQSLMKLAQYESNYSASSRISSVSKGSKK